MKFQIKWVCALSMVVSMAFSLRIFPLDPAVTTAPRLSIMELKKLSGLTAGLYPGGTGPVPLESDNELAKDLLPPKANSEDRWTVPVNPPHVEPFTPSWSKDFSANLKH